MARGDAPSRVLGALRTSVHVKEAPMSQEWIRRRPDGTTRRIDGHRVDCDTSICGTPSSTGPVLPTQLGPHAQAVIDQLLSESGF